MDKMELLKLALSHSKDPTTALALAREMAAFVAGEAQPEKPAQPISILSPARLKLNAVKRKTAWSQEEIGRAALLLDQGATAKEVGRIIGRTPRAVSTMFCTGRLPCKVRTKDEMHILSGKLGALAKKANGAAAN